MTTENPVKAAPVQKTAVKTTVAKPAVAATKPKVVVAKKTAKPAAKPVATKSKAPAKKTVTKAATKVATKAVKKVATKVALKPAGKLPVKAPAVKPVVQVKEKAKKAKLVRDSFTMPEGEYQVLSDVKKAFLKSGVSVKKSELLRAGVALIKNMELAKLNAVIAALAPIKAGRPKNDK